MARTQTKKVRVEIEGSVSTFASGYQIGTSLRKSSNVTYQYIKEDGIGVFPLGRPHLPILGLPLNPVADGPGGCGVWESLPGNSIFLTGAYEQVSTIRRIYNLFSGAVLPQTGQVLGAGPVSSPFNFAFAGNIQEPTTFVTAGGIEANKRIKQVVGVLKVVDYTPAPFDPNNEPDFEQRPRVCYYHLNRIFWGYQSIVTKRSIAFFSDPFNTNIVRGTNFVDIPDMLNVMFRASPSDLDIGNTPYLFFGCRSGIFVLSGDPTLGNATFRQIKKTLGIYSIKHVVEVAGGAVFLGTDSLLYFVASGNYEPVPISGYIREQFSYANTDIVLGWRNPYLYVIDSNPTDPKIWMADFSNFPRSIHWSGPHVNTHDVRAIYSDNPYSTNHIPIIGQTNARIGSMSVISTNATLQTGYFFEPDAQISFERAKFKIRNLTTVQNWSLKVISSDGTEVTRNFTVPALASAGADTIEHLLITLPPDKATVNNFFFLELTSDKMENLIDWRVEYRVTGRED